MRALKPFGKTSESLIEAYASRLAEAVVVRRAALEAKAARIEADLSIKARSQFLANMNHELRTPLNAIIGFASMLKDGDQFAMTDEKRAAYADYILQSADLLLGHINTLLETADLDGGTVEFRQEEVDLVALLDEAARRMAVPAEAAEVAIKLKSADGEVPAWVDAERMGQAIDHLLRIAIKASPRGAEILARVVENDAGWPEIAVRDNGDGLSPDEISSALSAFDEVHRGLDRSFEGPGVELAIAKTFIEMQGGRFSIKSRIGKGTLVRAALPTRKASGEADRERTREGQTAQAPVRLAG